MRESRRGNQIKGLPVVSFEASVLPSRVRKHKIHQLPFFVRRLSFEQRVRPVRQLQQFDAVLDVAVIGRPVRLDVAHDAALLGTELTL
jgi:hypothetical protein